jgi:hypothetical protein
MNIQSRKAIEQQARKAAETRNDNCPYPYGSDQRSIWVDTYSAALDARDCIDAMMSEKLKVAELV